MRNLRYMTMLAALLMLGAAAHAQTDRSEVRKGNRDFKKEEYKEADVDYRRALIKDSTSFAANYNLANTLYRLGDMEQARKSYERVKEAAALEEAGADCFYNLGNATAGLKDWQAAVDAYKESLLRNPGDIDAKENYIYAKEMLKKQQEQQQQQQQQQNEQNQDQQDQQDEQNQEQNNKDEQNKQNQEQEQQQQQQQGQQPKISPQAAQQMLQAIQAKEKETQDKVNKEKAEALKARQKDKNW